MKHQSYPKKATIRKVVTGPVLSPIQYVLTKRPQKSSRKKTTSTGPKTSNTLSSLLSSHCPDYPTPTTVIAVITMATVLSVLLYHNLEVFTNLQVFNNIESSQNNASLLDSDSESSGWRFPEKDILQKYGTNICTVERVSINELPPHRFETEFRLKKPVLVTFLNGAKDWTEPKKWSRSELSKSYSKWTIHSGQSLEIIRKGGNANHASSFQDFINKLMTDQNDGTHEPKHYAFDRKFYWHSDLPKTLHLPKYFQVNDSEEESIFFLGSSMTGVVFHKHSDTWNGVVYGRKRWFLYPNTKTPPGGVHHGFSLLEWVNGVYPHLADVDKPIECVQQPGEILYLPEGTYHATLNLGDTIAVAIQKKNPTIKAEELSYEATWLINFIQDHPEMDSRNIYNSRLLEVYKRWLELLPENSEAVMKIGDVLYDMGDYYESLPWHMRAIKMDPYFVMAYIHMAKTLSALRDYEKAEITFKKALEISPNLWDTYKEYGQFLLKQGRHEDALPIFRKGTELVPDKIPFWFYYKLCQVQTGDQEGAKASEKIIVKLKAKKELERD